MGVTLLVLAAGMGSRYGGLKQIDAIGPSGESIVDYSIYDAIEAGVNKVVFVIQQKFEKEFKERISNKYAGKIEILFVYQEVNDMPHKIPPTAGRKKPWGTGHAVWVAKSKIHEPFIVINADDFYGKESFLIISRHLNSLNSKDISNQCMIGFPLCNTLSINGPVSRAVCEIDRAGNLQQLTERTEISKKKDKIVFKENDNEGSLAGNEIVSMNMIGFTPAVFDIINSSLLDFMKPNRTSLTAEFYLPTILNDLVNKNETSVKVLTTTSSWFGITYKADKKWAREQINKLIEEKEYPAQLWPSS